MKRNTRKESSFRIAEPNYEEKEVTSDNFRTEKGNKF